MISIFFSFSSIPWTINLYYYNVINNFSAITITESCLRFQGFYLPGSIMCYICSYNWNQQDTDTTAVHRNMPLWYAHHVWYLFVKAKIFLLITFITLFILCTQGAPDRFSDLVTATGSGGSTAGLAIGNYLNNSKMKIHGMMVCNSNVIKKRTSIDDVTSVYLQQMQGIGLSIHLNELLNYSMAYNRACVTWREF